MGKRRVGRAEDGPPQDGAPRAADAPRTRILTQRSSGGQGPQLRAPTRRCFTPARQAAFFERLAETSNIRAAAEHAGVCQQTIWRWRRKDAEFARRWAEALAQGYADLEMRLLAQARFGATQDMEAEATDSGGRRVRLRRDTPGHGRLLLSHHRATLAAQQAAVAAASEVSAPAPAESMAEMIERLKERLNIMLGERYGA